MQLALFALRAESMQKTLRVIEFGHPVFVMHVRVPRITITAPTQPLGVGAWRRYEPSVPRDGRDAPCDHTQVDRRAAMGVIYPCGRAVPISRTKPLFAGRDKRPYCHWPGPPRPSRRRAYLT